MACREWAEERWEAVGLIISMAGALIVAAVLAVVFNVVSTRADRPRQDAAGASGPVSTPQVSVHIPITS